MSLSRAEKAGAGNFGSPPAWYLHKPLNGKPPAPDYSGLNAQETAQFLTWLNIQTAGGADDPAVNASLLPNVVAMTKLYKTYFASAANVAWAHQDMIWRNAQWRLDNVDAIDTADVNATLSISRDPTGVGANTSNAIAGTPTAPAIMQCTSTGNWIASSGSSGTIAATAQTITVPSGNSGNLRISMVKTGSGPCKCSINSGALFLVANNQIITLTTGQTLLFEMQSTLSGSSFIGTVYDNDTGQVVGTIDIENTS